jgi:hypothetical protein
VKILLFASFSAGKRYIPIHSFLIIKIFVYCPFKWIVSRDLHMFFLCHSIDLKFLHLMEPFVCFLNFVFVSNFSIFASRRSELTQSQSGDQRQDIFHWFFIGNYWELRKLRGGKEPRTGTVSIFKIIPPKQHLHERRSGPLQYGATTGDQLHSQGKLTTPGRENRKIRHENKILKANE